MEKYIGKVIRIDLDLYYVYIETLNNIVSAKVRGNQKKKGSVLVGDIVEVESVDNDFMISNVRNRTNSIIRPPVANIDQMVIVVSVGEPVPDYILLDKQIVLCMAKGIKPIICVNKIDLAESDLKAKEDIDYIKNVYSNLGIEIIFMSAKKGIGLDQLEIKLKGKTSAFSGNSGVGKSSITRKLIGEEEEKIEVGDIGKKSGRGKHTTKSVRIYNIDNESFILDTPGFSSYELYDIEYDELTNFYPEFSKIKCVYDDCVHVTEGIDVCNVKKELEDKKIDKGRYERYVYIYTKLKEQYDRKYK